MLKMGFQDDIERILQTTPETRQTVLFSFLQRMPAFLKKMLKTSKKPELIPKLNFKNPTVDVFSQFLLKEKEKEIPGDF